MIDLNALIQAAGGRYAVYRYHTAAPLGDVSRPKAWAGHYSGRTRDLNRRDSEHRSGQGARLLRAAVQREIPFHLDTIYACTSEAVAEQLELWLKQHGHARDFCQHCAAIKAGEIPPATPTIVRVTCLEDVTGPLRVPFQVIRDRTIARWTRRVAERRGDMDADQAPVAPAGRDALYPLVTEQEAIRRGWYIRRYETPPTPGLYPLEPVSEEEWQQIQHDRRQRERR